MFRYVSPGPSAPQTQLCLVECPNKYYFKIPLAVSLTIGMFLVKIILPVLFVLITDRIVLPIPFLCPRCPYGLS
jgi:hypothetical protein